MKRNCLFSYGTSQTAFSAWLLIARLFFGAMLFRHGYEKLLNFDTLSATFADPLGIGSQISLLLAIFAEVFCAVAFMLGFFFRFSVLPMIATMGVAFWWVHKGNVAGGELALIYLVVFLQMLMTGPGRFSLDALLSRHLR